MHRPKLTIAVLAALVTAPRAGIAASRTAKEGAMESKPNPSRDRAAIVETVENVARGADLRQWQTVEAAFAARVVLDYGTPELLTPQEIVSRWKPLLSAFDETQHVLRDIQVTFPEGTRARVSSAFQATHHLEGVAGGSLWTLEGRYEHELSKTDTGWQITRMRMIPGRSTGNPALVAAARARGGVPDPAPAGRSRQDRDENRRTVERFFASLEAKDIGAFLALWAEDGVQVMPFSPAGFPARLDGKAAIRKQYGDLPKNYESMRFPDREIHDLADPRGFFVTYRGEIRRANGGRYDNTYAGYFVVDHGKIREFHEYFNPQILERAFGAELQKNFNVAR
jgi:ketosteroid isomerase-like protein